MPERATITANGEPREVVLPCSVADFVGTCGLKPTQVVVEHNGKVIRREDLARTEIRQGDRLEVILPVAGG